jgi:fatty acid desaturase
LCSRIPYYQLPRALRDYPELRGVSRLTFLESFRCTRLVLWDESRRRLISFREMRRHVEREVIASIGYSYQDAKWDGLCDQHRGSEL